MKFFADTSYLANLYLDEALKPLARQIRDRFKLVATLTPLVRLELRLAVLHQINESAAWRGFEADLQAGKLVLEPVPWERLIEAAQTLALRHSRQTKPGTLDALHVASALHLGATHFISFDVRSRQRAFARAVGLKLVPPQLPS
jgi:predicted nucleic acid-binding protein